MWPKIFKNQSENQRSEYGFTLIEFIVAMALSSLVLLGVVKLFTVSQWSNKMQDQLQEMNMNAHYTAKKMMEVLSMAGADLPDSTFDVIIPGGNPSGDITMMVNPRGGTYELDSGLTNVTSIPVSDGSGFLYADHIIIHYSSGAYDTVSLSSVSENTLIIGTPKTFQRGDAIYSFWIQRYYLDSANSTLCDRNGDVISENLDLFSLRFLDINENATSSWPDMRFVDLTVRSRTSDEDPKYTHPDENDGYRRLELNMKFRLRNRI